MAKVEKEIKVLNIDVDDIKKKLETLDGVKFKGEKNQKIYVYDLPTLKYRFLEIRELLNTDNELLINTNKNKLNMLIIEFRDLINDDTLIKIQNELNINDINDIVELSIEKLRIALSNKILENEFMKFDINPNKWIRLRQSNDKVELTTKHVIEKQNTGIQNVLETEVEVSSLDETNNILASIGITRRSYQEKIRISYKYKNADIEIDTWPMLKPYLEVECDDEYIMNEIIEKLELDKYKIVSLNTEQLYRSNGIDVHNISDLKFK